MVKFLQLLDVISLLFLALMVHVFLSFLATSLLRCRQSGCWFLLDALFRLFYLSVLCLIYCSLLYDPFVSFYPSIVLRHHSIILLVVCAYLCMHACTCLSIIFHCELVILCYGFVNSFLPLGYACYHYHYYYYCYIDINIILEIRDRAI